jgi:DNA-binding transcriptional regulator/RsmH inhibitor MraZ
MRLDEQGRLMVQSQSRVTLNPNKQRMYYTRDISRFESISSYCDESENASISLEEDRLKTVRNSINATA